MANFNGLKQLFWAALSSIFLAVAFFFKTIAQAFAAASSAFNRMAGQ